MGRKKTDEQHGYGRLLDAWSAPREAGEPVAVLATSFTFSPAFFEEQCVGRFLRLDSDPSDGSAYLIEREEKLAQTECVAAIVDRQHCRGARNLRWDLLAAHVPGAVLHAKVALMHWSRRVRLLVTSANLTDDGYRRNLEVFGVVDFYAASPAPRAVLEKAVEFLRDVARYAQRGDEPGPALRRWHAALDRIGRVPEDWGRTWKKRIRGGWGVAFVGVTPGGADALRQLEDLWEALAPPERACVVSPFFDPPEAPNEPARRLWKLLKQRGEASVTWGVTAEDVPGEPTVLVHAPRSLLEAQPRTRAGVSSEIQRIDLPAHRPLHAKTIWLEHDHRASYMIGSSNFTSAGLGLGSRPNVEANLVYLVRRKQGKRGYSRLRASLPPMKLITKNVEIRFQPKPDEDAAEDVAAPALPDGFGEAVFDVQAGRRGEVTLTLRAPLPTGWSVLREDEDTVVLDEARWKAEGEPARVRVAWNPDHPPSGFRVQWTDSGGFAWWPVQVASAQALPPPSELKELSLEDLVEVLTSALPPHVILSRRKKTRGAGDGSDDRGDEVDPHKRVDASGFLLQRTRRVSWALAALRERLERPAVSEAALHWRLHGPLGVTALAEALQREAHSEEEAAFLLAELALELGRVRPRTTTGGVPVRRVHHALKQLIAELQARIETYGAGKDGPLWKYVHDVFAEVGT